MRYEDFLYMPSLEHRRQICRFLRLPFNDAEDQLQRRLAAWRRFNHACIAERILQERNRKDEA